LDGPGLQTPSLHLNTRFSAPNQKDCGYMLVGANHGLWINAGEDDLQTIQLGNCINKIFVFTNANCVTKQPPFTKFAHPIAEKLSILTKAS
jgi:hypothetical protein